MMDHRAIWIAVLMILTAYFSATQAAFLALNKARLKSLAEKGNRRAERAMTLADDEDRVLSATLTGHVLSLLALAGTAACLNLAWFPVGTAAWILAVLAAVTVLIAEVLPRSLADAYAERYVLALGGWIRATCVLLTPLTALEALWTRLARKIFRADEDHRMTQDELLMLVEEVEQEGNIGEDESNLLRSAIEFTDLDAEDILTHRVDLEALPVTSTKEEIARCFTESRYSRILLYGEDIDDIVGVLHLKDFYSGMSVSDSPVESLMAVPLFVPKSVKISDLLKQLQKHKTHMAVVIDEYGGTLGIVTMEDILEELVGEIWDEHDEVEESFHKVSENRYRVSADESTSDLFELFGMEAETESATIGGWVMDELERIPEVGDSFSFEDLVITVTAAEDHRVLEVEVEKIEAPSEEE